MTLPILPKGPVVGVKKNFAGELAEGANATFDVVVAKPDGTRLANRNVVWSLYKIERRYQWYNSDGRWGYEPVEEHAPGERRTADVETAKRRRGFPRRSSGAPIDSTSARPISARLRRPACPSRSVGRVTRPPKRRTFST